jgi:hypothetical protein
MENYVILTEAMKNYKYSVPLIPDFSLPNRMSRA